MYDMLQPHFYKPHMANDVFKILGKCRSCTLNESQVTHKWQLQLLPAARLLEFVVIDILEPLSKTSTRGQYVVIITDQVLKLTLAIHTATVSSTKIAKHC